jgi:hypothetical protein
MASDALRSAACVRLRISKAMAAKRIHYHLYREGEQRS